MLMADFQETEGWENRAVVTPDGLRLTYQCNAAQGVCKPLDEITTERFRTLKTLVNQASLTMLLNTTVDVADGNIDTQTAVLAKRVIAKLTSPSQALKDLAALDDAHAAVQLADVPTWIPAFQEVLTGKYGAYPLSKPRMSLRKKIGIVALGMAPIALIFAAMKYLGRRD
jgi:hypothetical protein